MESMDSMTELAKLTYSSVVVPKGSGADSDNGDVERLMNGVAFPCDLEDAPGARISPTKQRCKKCKKLDCVGVCEFV